MPINFTSASSFYSSSNASASVSDGNETRTAQSGHRYVKDSHTDRDGTTTVRTIRQDLGQPVIVEEHRYDQDGRELAALPDARSDGMKRIEDVEVDDDEDDADFKKA
ncbi:hypothetical protein BJY01DRAFT_211005 [Aspergillus pseudoustus]|uniref:Hypervirulence associated protein TUDOR domain-containing protein n=1 Tax=Aspergillus pseudoustus TaxID=1810923 RepID=A0ABR4KB60_9EURO